MSQKKMRHRRRCDDKTENRTERQKENEHQEKVEEEERNKGVMSQQQTNPNLKVRNHKEHNVVANNSHRKAL